MPVYEYYCDRCQHKYETIRSVSRMDEPAPCPKCGDPGRRQLSAFGFKDGRYGRFWRAGAPTVSSSKPEDGSTV
jgi:putative FmdB family regulatory protein